MVERSVNRTAWPWPAVLALALIALAALIFVPLLVILLLPVAAVALIAWGYVSYRHSAPGDRAVAVAAMAGGIALLLFSVLLVGGLTITTSTGESSGPVSAPVEATQTS